MIILPINVNALKQKVSKAINKLPNDIEVYREARNDLKEPVGETFVVKLTGQYYKGRNSFITLNLSDSGSVKSKQQEKFMAIIDENSLLVQEGDFFVLGGTRYKIVDLGNTLNVYFDFSLERK